MSFGVSFRSLRPHSMNVLQKAAPRFTASVWALIPSVITFFARASRTAVRNVSTRVRQIPKTSS